MSQLPPLPPLPARGTGKARFFASLGLMICLVAVGARRIDLIDTDTLLLSTALAVICAFLALIFVAVALADVWREGRPKAGSVFGTILLVLLTVTPPVAGGISTLYLPAIDDASTDLADPPTLPPRADRRHFLRLDLTEPKDREAALQSAAYPDLGPLVVDLSGSEAFALARAAVGELGWKLHSQFEPVTETSTGRLVATSHSIITGTPFDIAIRIAPGTAGTRIDMRSASHDILPDFGENARNIRAFFSKFQELEHRPAAG